jgi:hypothetical protein
MSWTGERRLAGTTKTRRGPTLGQVGRLDVVVHGGDDQTWLGVQNEPGSELFDQCQAMGGKIGDRAPVVTIGSTRTAVSSSPTSPATTYAMYGPANSPAVTADPALPLPPGRRRACSHSPGRVRRNRRRACTAIRDIVTPIDSHSALTYG